MYSDLQKSGMCMYVACVCVCVCVCVRARARVCERTNLNIHWIYIFDPKTL
jgi:hypothetical protein